MTLDARHALSPDALAASAALARVLDGDEPWLVARTSGSTGQSRRVALAASALQASSTATHNKLGGTGQWLLALPVDHIAGLQVLTRSIVAGIPACQMDLSEGFRTEGFVRATDAMTGSRRYVSLVPTQLRRLLEDKSGTAALASFDAILLGGAHTPAELLTAAASANVRVVTTYGMTETAGGCIYDGVPLDGVEVRTDNDGRIAIRGPVVTAGYLNDSGQIDQGLTAQWLTSDGWWLTNDVGTWVNQDGLRHLEVRGRMDDMIISGGVNVAPPAVESLVEQWLEIWQPDAPTVGGAPPRVCVIGLDDVQWGQRVIAVVAVPGRPQPNSADFALLRDRVRDALGPAAAPTEVFVVDVLPLVGLGKVNRPAIRRAVEAAL